MNNVVEAIWLLHMSWGNLAICCWYITFWHVTPTVTGVGAGAGAGVVAEAGAGSGASARSAPHAGAAAAAVACVADDSLNGTVVSELQIA